MALVKCRECGEQVSTGAAACPKCGAKPPKKTSLVTWAVLVLIVVAVYSSMTARDPTTPSSAPSPASSSATATPTTPPKPRWDVSTDIDKMTGKRQVYASSPIVHSSEEMDFPYRGVEAWIGVGCDGKSEWAYIGFSKSPNLTDTETERGYNVIKTRMKWDNAVEETTLIQEWGASFLHFQYDRHAISKIINSKSALLELKWYGQQRPHFGFSLEGASDAVKTMRSQCSKK